MYYSFINVYRFNLLVWVSLKKNSLALVKIAEYLTELLQEIAGYSTRYKNLFGLCGHDDITLILLKLVQPCCCIIVHH